MANKFPRIKVEPTEGKCERCGEHSKICIKNPFGHSDQIVGLLTCSECMISVIRETIRMSKEVLGPNLQHPILTQMEDLVNDLEKLERKNL